MRKTLLILPITFCAAGIAGFFLRRRELATIFNDNGLAVHYAPVSTALMILSIAVVIAALVIGISMKKLSCPNGLDAVLPKSQAGTIPFYVGAALTIVGGAMSYAMGPLFTWSATTLIFALFAIASGVAFVWLPLNGRKKGGDYAVGVFAVIPALMFCLWLIAGFRTKATEPEILEYCYEVLATAAMAFAAYCAAGYAFKINKPGRCVFSSLTALYFGITSLGSDMIMPLKLIMLGAVIIHAAVIATPLTKENASAGETAEDK
ncbi:MAG: hypothetical protein IKR21_00845 [Oscillospiraceae bacterium]|nr:hypothetical protein [Oscillospiraceae bacterium]